MEMSRDLVKAPGAKLESRSLSDGIARLRLATGKAERRVVLGSCSVKGGGFRHVYERMDPAAKFKTATVEKVTTDAQQTAGPAAPPARAEAFRADEFEPGGFACPWCGSKAGQIYCGRCAVNYCGGTRTIRVDGTEQFTCPTCRTTSGLIDADSLHGGSVHAGRKDTAAGLIGTEKKGLLSWRKE